MKKTFTRLVALVLVIGCVFTLVACAKPKLNMEKAKENLKAEDYTVSYTEESEEVGIESYLSASKLDSDGNLNSITIIKLETVKLAKLTYQAQQMEIEQEIESKKLELKAIKYTVNKFEDDLTSDEIDRYNDQIKELKDEIEELKDQLNYIGRSGKYVWFGSEDAIKATK